MKEQFVLRFGASCTVRSRSGSTAISQSFASWIEVGAHGTISTRATALTRDGHRDPLYHVPGTQTRKLVTSHPQGSTRSLQVGSWVLRPFPHDSVTDCAGSTLLGKWARAFPARIRRAQTHVSLGYSGIVHIRKERDSFSQSSPSCEYEFVRSPRSWSATTESFSRSSRWPTLLGPAISSADCNEGRRFWSCETKLAWTLSMVP